MGSLSLVECSKPLKKPLQQDRKPLGDGDVEMSRLSMSRMTMASEVSDIYATLNHLNKSASAVGNDHVDFECATGLFDAKVTDGDSLEVHRFLKQPWCDETLNEDERMSALDEQGPQDPPLPPADDTLSEAEHDHEIPPIDRLKMREERQLHKHRLEGHATYHPSCDDCRAARGVTHHKRRPVNSERVEVHADFGFLKDNASGDSHKFLCIVEPASNAVSYIYCSLDTEKVHSGIRRFLEYVGLAVEGRPVRVLAKTDDDRSLSRLFRDLGSIPDKAAPQAHETIGLAERYIRMCKEHLGSLRLDLQREGLDVTFSEAGLTCALGYLAWTENVFRRPRGGELTAHELLAGHSRTKPSCSLYGSLVFAEVPDSVTSPAGTRWVIAAFLGGQSGENGIFVSSTCVVAGQLVVKKFAARSIRPMNRIVFKLEYCQDLLVQISEKFVPAKDDDPKALPTPMPQMPKTGPPASWLHEHGRTPGCNGCSGPSFGKKVHSAACKKRYLEWVAIQRQRGDEIRREALQFDPSPDRPDEPASGSEHPTGKRRYTQKLPPVEAPSQMHSEPLEIDRSEPVDDDDDMYTPSLPGDMEVDAEPVDEQMSFVSSWTLPPGVDASSIGSDPKHVVKPLFLPRVGEKTKYDAFRLCGEQVFLAQPSAVFAEDMSKELDVTQAIAGRKTELEALDRVQFAKLISAKEARKSGCKIIGTRWVIGPKEIQLDENDASSVVEGVRMRLVVQEVAHGAAAASKLGLSSGTPSSEAVRAILIMCSQRDMWIATLDVSAAFLHSELPPGSRYVVRMPGDVSWSPTIHEPVYADLNRALNGLRCASKAWITTVRKICNKYGLYNSSTESCVFRGMFVDPSNPGESGFFVVLVLYVDDILCGSRHKHAAESLQKMLKEVVAKVKITGSIAAGCDGKVSFLGREIVRIRSEPDHLYLRVAPGYLEELVKDLKPVYDPPALDGIKEEQSEPLGDAQASEYRSKLGRLAWWTQTRVDFLRYSSILATGQQKPLKCHEAALVKVLKFAKGSLHLFQKFSWSEESELLVLADASWSTKSVSGFAIYWRGSLVKAASRQQAVMSLSSCEAELIALTHATQEALGLSRVLEFLEWGTQVQLSSIDEFLGRNVEDVHVDLKIKLQTDSMSAYQVVLSDAFTRKVRHLDISVGFLQRLCQLKVLEVERISTHVMTADLLTKCLSRTKHEFFRDKLGIVEVEPECPWQLLKAAKGCATHVLCVSGLRRWDSERLRAQHVYEDIISSGANFVWFDLCTEVGYRPLHLTELEGRRLFVVQSRFDDNRLDRCMPFFRALLELVAGNPQLSSFISFSPPCTGGSPMQNLTAEGMHERVSALKGVFLGLLRCFRRLQPMSNGALLELSNACSYWKLSEMTSTHQVLPCTARVDRCVFASSGRAVKQRQPGDWCADRHTFRLISSVPLESRRCPCRRHEWKSSLRELGIYPQRMVQQIAIEVLRCI